MRPCYSLGCLHQPVASSYRLKAQQPADELSHVDGSLGDDGQTTKGKSKQLKVSVVAAVVAAARGEYGRGKHDNAHSKAVG